MAMASASRHSIPHLFQRWGRGCGTNYKMCSVNIPESVQMPYHEVAAKFYFWKVFKIAFLQIL